MSERRKFVFKMYIQKESENNFKSLYLKERNKREI